MNAINNILAALADLFMSPFRDLPPAAGLSAVSVITGALLLLAFKHTSNQKAVAKARDILEARIIEIRLFSGDPSASLRAAGAALLANFGYLRYMLPPFLVAFIPVVLLLIHLEAFYANRPVKVGEGVAVTVKFNGAVPADDKFRIVVPPGARAGTPPVVSGIDKEITWRISAARAGEFNLAFIVDNNKHLKSFVAGEALSAARSARAESGFINSFLHPGEPTLPNDSGIKKINVYYPAREFEVFGYRINWILFFFIVSLLSGLILKPFFKVKF